MKISVLFMAISLLIFSACKKENTNYGSITAEISGYSFVSNSIDELIFGSSLHPGSILGYSYTANDEHASDSATLILSVDNPKQGAYAFTYQTGFPVGGMYPNISIEYVKGAKEYYTLTPAFIPSPGSIIITSNTSSGISGTFTGTLYYQYYTNSDSLVITNDSVVITNGVFTNLN